MKTIIFISLLISNALFAGSYPEEWFRPVPTQGAPSWEVLPQAAGPGEVILSKRNELGILSNFAATPFTYRGQRYASVEGFWQMMKFPENDSDFRSSKHFPYTRDQVANMTAFDAKNAGSFGEKIMKELGINWVTFEGMQMEYCSETLGEHYHIIKEAMWEKLQQNAEVKRIVLATGDLKLRPDHYPDNCRAPEWKYYEMWMEFRTILQTKN